MRYLSKVSAIILLVFTAEILFAKDYQPGLAQEQTCIGPFQSVGPSLMDLGDQPYVRMDGQVTEYTGGLYPNGSNQRPPEHEAAGVALAAGITPLDPSGTPDPINGRIVMISVGMSNTAREFGYWESLMHQDPQVNPKLVFVSGALGGQVADRWTDLDALPWQELEARLAHRKVTPEQVQVAWVKQTLTRGGDFPDKALMLQSALEEIARNLKTHYPNIKIAYVSSRTRSYTYWRGLSPEPLAFETGFAVKWMIEKQIQGDPGLNYDPARGEVKAPYLSWGPYLWADGLDPRSDGFTWTQEDLADDCTHPSESGVVKVAELLTEFFTTDSTSAPWFLSSPLQSVPVATAVAVTPSHTEIAATQQATTAASVFETPTLSPAKKNPSAEPATQPTVPISVQNNSPAPINPPFQIPLASTVVVGIFGLAFGLGTGWLLWGKR